MVYLFVARNAGAVIHSHSKAAVMATLLYPGTEFRVTHLEMIKVNEQYREKLAYFNIVS